MSGKSERIDDYIAKSRDFAKPMLTHLRALIHDTCPEVEETWKWSFPHFMYNGAILCSMAAFKNYCAFSFWKSSLIDDNKGVLTLENRESMGHLGKIERIEDLPADSILREYILAAMKLNEDGIKVAKKRPPENEHKQYVVPDYFTAELDKNRKARDNFNSFSNSARKEYLEWFDEAKTEITRNKRIAQAMEWIEEGKSRHWKYKNC